MGSRFYTAPDGERYPLTEARYGIDFKAYRSDRRKARQGDPSGCWAALGIKRNKNVLHVYIGSGRDAYVVFKANDDESAHAVHFTIKTSVRKLIDAFDKDKSAKTQIVRLDAPTPGRTLEARQNSGKRRREEIRNGAPIKKRGPSKNKRITRLGVEHRPRARITRGGSVSMAVEEQVASV
jgi:hypothetical protein